MKFLVFIFLIFFASSTPQKKTTQQTVLQEPDTIFLPIENLKGKVWVDAFMANHEGTMLLQSFINDTVVKYYSGIAPSCWEENYT